MARRYNEGSLYEDRSKGLWVARLEMGYQPDGRRIQKKVTARTKAEARAALRALVKERDEGALASGPAMTTAQWLGKWTADILPGTVAPRTEEMYAQVCRDWIIPHIGRIPLAQLRPEDVAAMMRALHKRGLSPSTQRKARTILRRALTVAQKYNRVGRNVAALTEPPKAGRESTLDDALDAGEAVRVLDAARGDRLEALAVLVLTMGIRQGEALRLRWSDLDDNGILAVPGTKSAASARFIQLPPMTIDALRAHKARQRVERMAAPLWGDPDLMFTTTIGTAIHRRNALAWWHRLTIAAGVGRRRFHASRHTAATLMLNNGVPLEIISSVLGHAGLAITADIYAKVRPELERQAADTMQRVLGRNEPYDARPIPTL
jgi:integrase